MMINAFISAGNMPGGHACADTKADFTGFANAVEGNGQHQILRGGLPSLYEEKPNRAGG